VLVHAGDDFVFFVVGGEFRDASQATMNVNGTCSIGGGNKHVPGVVTKTANKEGA
jgi:hypothetical protein